MDQNQLHLELIYQSQIHEMERNMRCTCPPALIYEIYINLPAGAPTMNAAIEPFERPALNDWTGGAGEEISVNIHWIFTDIYIGYYPI